MVILWRLIDSSFTTRIIGIDHYSRLALAQTQQLGPVVSYHGFMHSESPLTFFPAKFSALGSTCKNVP